MKMISIKKASRNLIMLLLLSGFTAFTAMAQKPAYKLFREDGKKVKYEKMAEAAADADIVLFGEYHTNPISHWIQLELTKDLFEARGEALILGAEMFEADNQLILNEYLAGQITETKFEEEARLWKNYKTDYKPLVLIAKENELTFVATNIPRRYANMVFKRGVVSLDSLSDEALSYIAPLPLEYDTSLSCYKQLMGSAGGPTEKATMPMAAMPKDAMHKSPMGDSIKATGDTPSPIGDTISPMGEAKLPMGSASPIGGHGSRNLADAQAIKDATMSHFIMEYWQPGKLFIHYNGAYHSDEFESMNWFLKRANPDLKIITISTVSQDDVALLEEESEGKADFIIAVPSSMTQTSR
ncbi:MAG: iron-regulated protein [Bacteroidetes bacterium]|nr:MAG: iron-regulated protein [Bacteroidota bacterium]